MLITQQIMLNEVGGKTQIDLYHHHIVLTAVAFPGDKEKREKFKDTCVATMSNGQVIWLDIPREKLTAMGQAYKESR